MYFLARGELRRTTPRIWTPAPNVWRPSSHGVWQPSTSRMGPPSAPNGPSPRHVWRPTASGIRAPTWTPRAPAAPTPPSPWTNPIAYPSDQENYYNPFYGTAYYQAPIAPMRLRRRRSSSQYRSRREHQAEQLQSSIRRGSAF